MHPHPRSLHAQGGVEKIESWRVSFDGSGADVFQRREASLFGASCAGGTPFRIVSSTTRDPAFPMVGSPSRCTDERYRMAISRAASGWTVELVSSTNRGLLHGLSTLSLMLRRGECRECEIDDYPLFPLRGIIEGYYGPPWAPEARRGVLDFISARKMNAYFYAPKDDPFHREK